MPKTLAAEGFSLAIEYYREEDGRGLADIAALPGVTAYGRTKKQATAGVQALAFAPDRRPSGARRSSVRAHERFLHCRIKAHLRIGRPSKRRGPWPRCSGSAGESNVKGSTSHRILERSGWPDVRFAYHDKVTLGPAAMKVLSKKTRLTLKDL